MLEGINVPYRISFNLVSDESQLIRPFSSSTISVFADVPQETQTIRFRPRFTLQAETSCSHCGLHAPQETY